MSYLRLTTTGPVEQLSCLASFLLVGDDASAADSLDRISSGFCWRDRFLELVTIQKIVHNHQSQPRFPRFLSIEPLGRNHLSPFRYLRLPSLCYSADMTRSKISASRHSRIRFPTSVSQHLWEYTYRCSRWRPSFLNRRSMFRESATLSAITSQEELKPTNFFIIAIQNFDHGLNMNI